MRIREKPVEHTKGSKSNRFRKSRPSVVVEYRQLFTEPIGTRPENRVAILPLVCEIIPSKYGLTVTRQAMDEANRNCHHRIIALRRLVDWIWLVVLPSYLQSRRRHRLRDEA